MVWNEITQNSQTQQLEQKILAVLQHLKKEASELLENLETYLKLRQVIYAQILEITGLLNEIMTLVQTKQIEAFLEKDLMEIKKLLEKAIAVTVFYKNFEIEEKDGVLVIK